MLKCREPPTSKKRKKRRRRKKVKRTKRNNTSSLCHIISGRTNTLHKASFSSLRLHYRFVCLLSFFPPLSFLWPKHVKLLSLRGWEKAGFKGLRKIKTNTGSFMGPTPTPLAQLLPLSSPLPLHYRYATPPLPLRQRYRYITAISSRRCATDTATLPLYYRYATPTLLLHYH